MESVKALCVLFLIMIPFAIMGIWKFIEIITWLIQHIHISVL